MGIVTTPPLVIFELHDELVCLGLMRGRENLRLAGIGPAVDQVLAHRPMEQRGILGDHADVLPQ